MYKNIDLINDNYNKPIIFLISHENSRTGYPIALLNVKKL